MAYFLGLLIGGGTITDDKISIEFPYKDWAHEDFRISPEWFNDSVNKIIPLIKNLLNSNGTPRCVTDHTPRYYIDISPIPQLLYEVLKEYQIPHFGQLRRKASIKRIIERMDTDCQKKFISGLADVIGSCRSTHRHRTLESTMISFEIIGNNWNLPYELCQTLHNLEVPVDQILWNHPNMHAGKNPDAYWKKGHKVRVRAGDFEKIGYGLECKRIGLKKLLELEEEKRGYISKGKLCPNRHYRINRVKVVHSDEESSELPEKVRKHFVHYTQICFALGCPHAPKSWLEQEIPRYMP
ncbi:MAG: hypothetical protein QW279_11575 [Candidatus Jordarchaeaceae archaeon]